MSERLVSAGEARKSTSYKESFQVMLHSLKVSQRTLEMSGARFIPARCPSYCHPTNSVEALNEDLKKINVVF